MNIICCYHFFLLPWLASTKLQTNKLRKKISLDDERDVYSAEEQELDDPEANGLGLLLLPNSLPVSISHVRCGMHTLQEIFLISRKKRHFILQTFLTYFFT
jgi:hypothetical protein